MPARRCHDRDLPSWPCEFDSRHPLHRNGLAGGHFDLPWLRCPLRLVGDSPPSEEDRQACWMQ